MNEPIPPKSPRHAIWAVFRAAERMEEAYEATEGEVTEEAEAAEALLREQGDLALDALAEYVAAQGAVITAAKTESDRLALVRKAAERRAKWAKGWILDLLGDRKSTQAGTRRVSVRSSAYVHTPETLDPKKLPKGYVREIVRVELDKSAARDALKAGDVPELEALGIELRTRRSAVVR